jgi:hypothetical protein
LKDPKLSKRKGLRTGGIGKIAVAAECRLFSAHKSRIVQSLPTIYKAIHGTMLKKNMAIL